ncbi:MAG: tetratricopeptide repeat protein [bacterium]|nr:tetratricopeptide repeat protein [bacterium]
MTASAATDESDRGPGTPGQVLVAGDKRFWWGVVAIVVVAFGVRLAYLYQVGEMPFFNHPVGDAAAYWSWAGDVRDGDWIGDEPFYQAPAYPYFLAVVRSLVGDDLWRVRVVQIGLGALACGLLAVAGRWFTTSGAGLVAGLFMAVYGPAVFFDGLIQKATLGSLLMAVLLCLLGWVTRLPRASTEPSRDREGAEIPETNVPAKEPLPDGRGSDAPQLQTNRRTGTRIVAALAIGVTLGLLALTREQALLLAPVVVVWLGMGRRGERALSHHPWAMAVWCVVGLFVVLGPVAYRNYRVSGEVLLTTYQAGPNFYIGNHAGATGRYVALRRGHESPAFERRDATELAEAAVGRELSPREVSRHWWGRAWEYIGEHPFEWIGLLAYKWMLVWNAYEIPDTESFSLYSRLSWLLGVCGGVCHFGVLCPLAAVGIVATARRWRELWLLYALLLTVALGVAVFYVFARYRYPLVPVLALFAGVGVCECRALLLRMSGRGTGHGWMVGALGIAATTALATNIRVNPEDQLDGMAYANLGVVLGQEEEYAAAAAFLEMAVERVPDSAEARYNLGLAYRFLGNHESALLHLRCAQELDAELIAVDAQLGVVCELLGHRTQALAHYRRAVRIDPDDELARQGVERMRAQEAEQ